MSEKVNVQGISPENILLIEKDFMSGSLNRKELCNKYKHLGLNATKLEYIASKLKWVNIRSQSAEIVREKAKAKVAEIVDVVIEENQVQLEEFIVSELMLNKGHYNSFNKMQEIVDEILDNKAQVFNLPNGNVRRIPLSIDDLHKLSTIVSNIQGGQRKAVGLDKKIEDKGGNKFQNINIFGDLGQSVRDSVIAKASANFESISKLVEENISE